MSRNDRIARFDDYEAVRFFRHVGGQILDGCKAGPDALRDGVDVRLMRDDRLRAALAMSAAEARRTLSIAEAAPAARAMLGLWAADRRTAPALKAALAEWRDDEMVVEVILAAGFVASLLMCTASIELEGKIGGFKIKKGPVNAEAIKAVVDLIVAPLTRAPKA